jgi:hypothetical protein
MQAVSVGALRASSLLQWREPVGGGAVGGFFFGSTGPRPVHRRSPERVKPGQVSVQCYGPVWGSLYPDGGVFVASVYLHTSAGKLRQVFRTVAVSEVEARAAVDGFIDRTWRVEVLRLDAASGRYVVEGGR